MKLTIRNPETGETRQIDPETDDLPTGWIPVYGVDVVAPNALWLVLLIVLAAVILGAYWYE